MTRRLEQMTESLERGETVQINKPLYQEPRESLWKHEQAKYYYADTLTSLIVGNGVFGSIEFATLDFDEFVDTRKGMNALALFTSRPYGAFRRGWANLTNTDANSSRLRKFASDVSANCVYYGPLYSIVLKTSGASWGEIATTWPTALVTATILGRPFGMLQDKIRKGFGLKPILAKEAEQKISQE